MPARPASTTCRDGRWRPTTRGRSATEPCPRRSPLIASTTNPFSAYTGEILRAEGFSFATVDTAHLPHTARLLRHSRDRRRRAHERASDDVVELGSGRRQPDRASSGQATRSLLGLTDLGLDAVERLPQASTPPPAPGAGIVGQTMQFHGTADRYTLNGATAVASLYSNATTATVNPAVTLRSVGSNGGQAAAFTFDLARSIVLTRQGNPSWVGQERDGVVGIRPDDLFFGAKAGDVQPDWLDTTKIEFRRRTSNSACSPI